MYIVHVAYCVRDKSSSLYACRLDCLEQVHQSLCLQPLQLGVQADERPSATHSVTAGLKKLNFSKYFMDFDKKIIFINPSSARMRSEGYSAVQYSAVQQSFCVCVSVLSVCLPLFSDYRLRGGL